MGTFSSFSYSNRITMWTVTGTDDYNQKTFSTPMVVDGTFKNGSFAARDSVGNEFVPSMVFYFESSTEPQPQWYIALGEHTGNPPASAELIRRVDPFDTTLFQNNSTTDYRVMT